MKIFLCSMVFFLSLSLSSVLAEESSAGEKQAKNWEKVISTALEQKYQVRARIYMGKSEKIIDIDRVGHVLILTLKNKDKIALTMPFKTTDKDGNVMNLFFEFEK